jgi:catechol 2,3-dioxygenase-like lactoylglutathione lyase family enzyme
MITRLDHVVIGVADLDQAIQAYQQLGFEVRPGGRHTGLGTHNALIRFELEYLELLAVYDAAEAVRSGGPGQFMIEYLRERPGALLGFALASENLDDEVARGVPGQPFAMERARPDGHVLSWRLLIPGEHTWRRPWPFLIQWDTPDQQRVALDGVGQHANGTVGIGGLRVAARDVPGAIGFYRNQLGLPVTSSSVALPNCPIEIVQSENDEEGLVEVQLRASERLAVPLEQSLGAQLVFVT